VVILVRTRKGSAGSSVPCARRSRTPGIPTRDASRADSACFAAHRASESESRRPPLSRPSPEGPRTGWPCRARRLARTRPPEPSPSAPGRTPSTPSGWLGLRGRSRTPTAARRGTSIPPCARHGMPDTRPSSRRPTDRGSPPHPSARDAAWSPTSKLLANGRPRDDRTAHRTGRRRGAELRQALRAEPGDQGTACIRISLASESSASLKVSSMIEPVGRSTPQKVRPSNPASLAITRRMGISWDTAATDSPE
jgi:hypothetical protein